MPYASFSVPGPGGTGCDEVIFPVYGGLDTRDVSVDYVKECMSFAM